MIAAALHDWKLLAVSRSEADVNPRSVGGADVGGDLQRVGELERVRKLVNVSFVVIPTFDLKIIVVVTDHLARHIRKRLLGAV